LVTNQTQLFKATVQNSTNQSVTWYVNGALGGSGPVGFIDMNGMYAAPSTVPSPATVTVTATSVATPTASGSASVTITAPVVSVTVSPTTASVRTNRTRQFTATVNGSSNQ